MTSEEIKRNVGSYAASFVQPGMNIGLGSGTTIFWLIEELKKRVEQGLSIKAVPTSIKTQELAEVAGINLVSLESIDELDLDIDGADQFDLMGRVIKGGGGALLQEKIVANASRELIIIADESKLTTQFGNLPLPVEVIPFGHRQVMRKIQSMTDCKNVKLRTEGGQPFITDHEHYILDCEYGRIDEADRLSDQLHRIPGVVETGLFLNMANKAVIGYENGKIEILNFAK